MGNKSAPVGLDVKRSTPGVIGNRAGLLIGSLYDSNCTESLFRKYVSFRRSIQDLLFQHSKQWLLTILVNFYNPVLNYSSRVFLALVRDIMTWCWPLFLCWDQLPARSIGGCGIGFIFTFSEGWLRHWTIALSFHHLLPFANLFLFLQFNWYKTNF